MRTEAHDVDESSDLVVQIRDLYELLRRQRVQVRYLRRRNEALLKQTRQVRYESQLARSLRRQGKRAFAGQPVVEDFFLLRNISAADNASELASAEHAEIAQSLVKTA